MKLDVCICTHNPRRDILRRVLEALARQSLRKERFHVWFIDNASAPPISLAELALLSQAGVGFTMLQEPRPGQIFARARAIEASTGPWMVFVDDDTVLAADYLERVAEIAAEHPELGCFGGKLLLPEGLAVPDWVRPMLPYVAIKDCGEEPITRYANEWGLWEPPGGGAAVCRAVLESYVWRLAQNPEIARLGRKGQHGLFSCDDSLMMRGAYSLGLSCSYQPRLRLEHHLAPHRFKFSYLARLLYALGRSRVVLERALGGTVPAMPSAEGRRLRRETWRLLRRVPWNRVQLCQQAQQWGYFLESRAEPRLAHGLEMPEEQRVVAKVCAPRKLASEVPSP